MVIFVTIHDNKLKLIPNKPLKKKNRDGIKVSERLCYQSIGSRAFFNRKFVKIRRYLIIKNLSTIDNIII